MGNCEDLELLSDAFNIPPQSLIIVMKARHGEKSISKKTTKIV